MHYLNTILINDTSTCWIGMTRSGEEQLYVPSVAHNGFHRIRRVLFRPATWSGDAHECGALLIEAWRY